MSRRFIFALYLIFTSIACSTDSEKKADLTIPMIENALTFEFAFGNYDLPEEYLLAKPNGLVVKDNGDILVPDEYFVKVYDSAGNPKEMLGGKGQGPGEFEAPMRPSIAPSGYITVMDILWEYNLFGPDNEFILKRKLKTVSELNRQKDRENFNFTMMEQITALDKERRVMGLFGQNMEHESEFPAFKFILYLDADSLTELVKYHSMSNIKNKNGGGSNGISYQGDLHWGFVDADHIVYTETYYDKEVSEAGANMLLKIMSINRDDPAGFMNERKLTIPYTPNRISDYLKDLNPHYSAFLKTEFEVNATAQNILNDTEYFPPFEELLTDGKFVFLFKYNIDNEETEKSHEEDEDAADRAGREYIEEDWERAPVEVDIVDSVAGKIVSRTTMPFVPQLIKDGYAYRLLKPSDDFPTVEKYKISPAVYGR